MVKITEDGFSTEEVVSKLKSKETGAVVVFLGFVKGVRDGDDVSEMIIEAHEKIAEEKLSVIRDEALRRFDVMDATIIHRVGRLKPSDNIVIVAVSAKSRSDAFKACSWIIDEVKKTAPIWKKELTSKGWRWVREEKALE